MFRNRLGRSKFQNLKHSSVSLTHSRSLLCIFDTQTLTTASAASPIHSAISHRGFPLCSAVSPRASTAVRCSASTVTETATEPGVRVHEERVQPGVRVHHSHHERRLQSHQGSDLGHGWPREVLFPSLSLFLILLFYFTVLCVWFSVAGVTGKKGEQRVLKLKGLVWI